MVSEEKRGTHVAALVHAKNELLTSSQAKRSDDTCSAARPPTTPAMRRRTLSSLSGGGEPPKGAALRSGLLTELPTADHAHSPGAGDCCAASRPALLS